MNNLATGMIADLHARGIGEGAKLWGYASGGYLQVQIIRNQSGVKIGGEEGD